MIDYEISAENIPQNSQASSPDQSEKTVVHVSYCFENNSLICNIL